MSKQQVPLAQSNFTNEHGLSEHGLVNKDELKGEEFTGTPESSGRESQTTGQKVTSNEVIPEKPGKTEGSLAAEAKSFAQ